MPSYVLQKAAAEELIDNILVYGTYSDIVYEGFYVDLLSGTQPAGPHMGIPAGTRLARLNYSWFPWDTIVQETTAVTAYFQPTKFLSFDFYKAGTATWFRAVGYTELETYENMFDGTVGTSNSDLIVPTTSIEEGVEFRLSKFDVSIPYAYSY